MLFSHLQERLWSVLDQGVVSAGHEKPAGCQELNFCLHLRTTALRPSPPIESLRLCFTESDRLARLWLTEYLASLSWLAGASPHQLAVRRTLLLELLPEGRAHLEGGSSSSPAQQGGGVEGGVGGGAAGGRGAGEEEGAAEEGGGGQLLLAQPAVVPGVAPLLLAHVEVGLHGVPGVLAGLPPDQPPGQLPLVHQGGGEAWGGYSSKDPECPFREDKKYFSKLRKPFQKWHYRKVFLAGDQKYFSVTKITFLLLEILFWISNKVPITPTPIFTFLGSPKKNCTKNTFL